MTIGEFIDSLRAEYTKQLEATGTYTKPGMQLAFEHAVTAALVRATDEGRKL